MTKENKVNGWMIIAIIFIVLFVLETVFLIGIFSVGSNELDKESECAFDICDEYDSYSYDVATQICECWDEPIISKKI